MGRVVLFTGSRRSAVSLWGSATPQLWSPGFTIQVERAAQFPSALGAEVVAVAYFDPYKKNTVIKKCIALH